MCLLANHFSFKNSPFNRELSSGKITLEYLYKVREGQVITAVLVEGEPAVPVTVGWRTMLLDTNVLYNDARYSLCQSVDTIINESTLINFKSEVVCDRFTSVYFLGLLQYVSFFERCFGWV